jgi:serine protease
MTVLKLPDHESRRLSPSALRDRTLREIERLNTLSSVEFAQPNYLYRPAALPNLPNDALYSYQWHYPLIKLDHVWSENLVDPADLTNVIVAVIDTGIARSNGTKSGNNHDDLGGAGTSPFVDEYDFISSASRARDGDGYDNDATDLGDHPPDQPDLASFHGTHVIGTIGAYTGNTTGVAGVAGGPSSTASVRIMPLRALGYGGGTTADIVDAIKYAARIPNSTGKLPSEPADIINMSLGSTANDPALKSAVDAAYAKGVLIVASAGNKGNPETFYPAGYPSVVSVSAVDIGAEVTSYSNYNSTVEVAAPGGSFSYDLNFDTKVDGVLSTFSELLGENSFKTDLYAFLQGTSMASPHVAGLAALIKANNPSFSAADIRNRLQSHVIDLGSAGRDDFYGYGMINAYAAVNSGAGISPVLFPFPKKLKLMGDDPSAVFTLKNINDSSSISVSSITKENNVTWLSVSPGSGSADSTGIDITVSVDTTTYPQLENGATHTEMLNISSTAGDEHVYVLYNSSGFSDSIPEDIGDVYVVAINEDDIQDDIIIDYYDITRFENDYRYRIHPISSGTYIIGASTDHDSDLTIFEPEDYYGFYISVEQIEPIDVIPGNRHTGIDFDMLHPSTQQ